ncbi:MAG: hypothetical protein ACNYNY_05980 [Candidatus Oxydemutatoraceae bacterium WSBS_2016_MAG_OTU14]
MENTELLQRVNILEKTIRNMRIAVIVIVAFFLYESIAPAGFGQMDVRVMETLKLKQLMLLDQNNQVRMRLTSDEDGGQFILEDAEAGSRVVINDKGFNILESSDSGWQRALHISKKGLMKY